MCYNLLLGSLLLYIFYDILIYSSSMDQHLHHLREVLSALRRGKLYAHAHLMKCEMLTTMNRLGFIISAKVEHSQSRNHDSFHSY
jgi:DNA-binding winged helix-turn-helix (wHTH) protein